MFNLNKKKTFNSDVNTTMETLSISKAEATKRVNALLKSKLLDGGHPDEKWFQMIIENFMRFSSEDTYDTVFKETLNFPAFIQEYDIIQKTNLGIELHISRLNKKVSDALVEETKKFDAFLYENFWNKMQSGYLK